MIEHRIHEHQCNKAASWADNQKPQAFKGLCAWVGLRVSGLRAVAVVHPKKSEGKRARVKIQTQP